MNPTSLKARRSLGLGLNQTLIGRDQELGQIRQFLDQHLTMKKPGFLYISGHPGSGKTATVKTTLKNIQLEYDLDIFYLNCMECTSSLEVLKLIYEKLGSFTPRRKSARQSLSTSSNCQSPATKKTLFREMVDSTERCLTSRKNFMILCLDEIDHLLTSNGQDFLIILQKWSSNPCCKVVFMGIANALDLVDRMKTENFEHCKSSSIDNIHFAPYTKDQVIEILKFRLKDVDILSPAAIEICARKVSAITGDIRKALELCKAALDQQKSECIEPKEILESFGRVYGKQQQENQGNNFGLPFQQKVVLSVLFKLTSGSCEKAFTTDQVYKNYKQVCKDCKYSMVNQAEFSELCQNLTHLSLFSSLKSRKSDLNGNKYRLNIDTEAVKRILSDDLLMESILK